ncbi:hypothetical protein Lalb_Chr06g0176461 [Lupinus albus]|uniref:Uncharacterized protein n=1 Tax=Lupinus albus TaxID=3870 RepID=A0A6A4QF83_LUPAL|nr:hypothetical protein Lalb_Chr06g0176461 [Lupinus albus]
MSLSSYILYHHHHVPLGLNHPTNLKAPSLLPLLFFTLHHMHQTKQKKRELLINFRYMFLSKGKNTFSSTTTTIVLYLVSDH